MTPREGTAELERRRSHLNHSVLRNGLLAPLTWEPRLVGEPLLPLEARVERLSSKLRTQGVLPETRGLLDSLVDDADGTGIAFERCALAIFDSAGSLDGYRLADEAPSREDFRVLVNEVGGFIRAVASGSLTPQRDSQRITTFWRNALRLHEILNRFSPSERDSFLERGL